MQHGLPLYVLSSLPLTNQYPSLSVCCTSKPPAFSSVKSFWRPRSEMQPQFMSRSLCVLRTRGGAGLQRLGGHRNFALPPRRARSPQVKGEVTPMRTVPASIPAPPYAATGRVPSSHPPAEVHSAEGISLMRVACREAADLLTFAGKLVVPGATGEDIDRSFHEEAVRRGVYPSPLNYAGFPKSLCVSINEGAFRKLGEQVATDQTRTAALCSCLPWNTRLDRARRGRRRQA